MCNRPPIPGSRSRKLHGPGHHVTGQHWAWRTVNAALNAVGRHLGLV